MREMIEALVADLATWDHKVLLGWAQAEYRRQLEELHISTLTKEFNFMEENKQ